MEKKVIVKEYNISNYNNTFLNSTHNECFICYSNDNKLILMNNRFCNCYDNVIICEECFIKWLFKNCKCFICRKKFVDDNNNRFNIFRVLINDVYLKILIKMEERHINQFPNDNIHIDRTTRSYHNRNNNSLDYFAINRNNYRGMIIVFLIFCIAFFSTFSIINYTYYLTN